MSVATDNPNPIKASDGKVTDVATSLMMSMKRIADRTSSLADYYEAAFELIAKTAKAKWGEINLQEGGRTLSRTYAVNEKLNAQALLDLTTTLAVESQVVNEPKSRLAESGGKTFCLTTCPFNDERGQSLGSLTLFAQIASSEIQSEFEGFISTSIDVMQQCRKTEQPEPISEQEAQQQSQLTALEKATKFSDIRELIFALTNSFCQKFNCQRTAMGLIHNQHIKLQSISGTDSFVENSPVVVDIRQAMEECYDHGNRIVVQHKSLETEIESDQFFLNKRLHEQTGGAAVCSVPFRSNDEIVGVLNLQRDLSQPFTTTEVESIEQSLNAYAPALELMRKVSQPISTHVKDKVRQRFKSTFAGSALKRKIAGLALLASLLFFFIGYIPFSPKIPCTVQSRSAKKIAAPFDGVIESAPFAAGDKVEEGQIILSFDTKDLVFQGQSLAAQVKSLKVTRDSALKAGKTADAAIAAAEIQVLQAQQEGVQQQIANASVVAPFSGTIIRGDLRQQIGQPIAVGTELFEIANNEQMRIELAIPESTASYIESGQNCKFVLASHPGSRLNCKIERVTPSTMTVDGRNVVMAEAIVESEKEWLQSGMEGVAKVKTGWQPVWWVTTRSVLDQLRLGFWL